MWNENPLEWKNLKGLLTDCIEGSRIIVTSGSKKVAKLTNPNFQPYELGILDLFKNLGFEQGCHEQDSSTILDVAKEIVKKCGGVPLAISMIGSMLYPKKFRNRMAVVPPKRTFKHIS
ncbi:NB-ARC domain containing protein [Parasponia andersonii]|uniref:NB-ARC domain containing protein n=1 Tax=Parasponia andersonii TaxID=3476 RepID=A0A2P5ATW3_PARAD|nr:NB-ARC domain containing protein [Parasponia andersonii]